jgi:hypothetical protein
MPDDEPYVRACHRWKNNSELIAEAARLYIPDDALVIDVTYGKGNWWKQYRPPPDQFLYHDWKLDRVDFTDLPYPDCSFDVVAYDPPYKLNGSATSSLDKGGFHVRWGLTEVANKHNRYTVLKAGQKECARVTDIGGLLLMKCQNQSQGGRVHWQTYDFKEYGEEECGLKLIDEFEMIGHWIKQSTKANGKPRVQKRAHGRPSVLQVYQKVAA